MKKLALIILFAAVFTAGAGEAKAQSSELLCVYNSASQYNCKKTAVLPSNCTPTPGQSDFMTCNGTTGAPNGYTCSVPWYSWTVTCNGTPPAASTPSTAANPNAFCSGGKCTYTPLEPLPGLPSSFGPNDSFASIAGGSIKIFIWLGAIIAVVILTLGALTYMFSDVVTSKTRAIARIRSAMWGLLLLGASWLILNTINPQLTTFNLKIAPTPTVQTATPFTSSSFTLTPLQTQSALNQCNAQCAPTTGSLQTQSDNSIKCTCATGSAPI